MLNEPGAGASVPSVSPERCANTRHKDLDCRRCQQVCPAQAIPATRPLVVDSARCVSCGLCAVSCPVEAIAAPGPGDQALTGQIHELLEEGPDLELACRRAVESGLVGRGCRQVLQITCLARLPGVVLAAAMTRARGSVWLNDMACHDCPLGKVTAHIRVAITEARSITEGLGIRGNVACLTDGGSSQSRRHRRLFGGGNKVVRVTRSGERTLSRRGLFLVFRQGPLSGPEPSIAGLGGSTQVSRLSERRRVLAGLINAAAGDVDDKARLLGPSFGKPVLIGACSGCGVCARVCPTSALDFHVLGHEATLVLNVLRCVGCGACVAACGARALTIEDGVLVAALKGGAATVLWQGGLVPCSRCGSLYHQTESTSTRCPLCSLLQNHKAPTSVASC